LSSDHNILSQKAKNSTDIVSFRTRLKNNISNVKDIKYSFFPIDSIPNLVLF
jgi:hypothetical protein